MPGHSELMEQKKMALDIENATKEIGTDKVKAFMDSLPEMPVAFDTPLKERLEKFKEDMGDVMFGHVSSGESLMPTLDRWVGEQVEAYIKDAVERTAAFFKESNHPEISQSHVYMMFSFITLSPDE